MIIKMNKVAVIGGGAAGLAAAIAAARNGAGVVICEKGARAAKKLLATGNGRCNMTNINADVKNYHGKNPGFVKGVMHRFWVDETLSFFREIGLLAKTEEDGRVYPYSLQAAAVSEVLRLETERVGVETICDFDVVRISRKKGMYNIISRDGRKISADCVILACGGKASPNLGSDGSGYPLAESFGHKVTKLYPSLVQIKTDNTYTKALQGLKINGNAVFFENNKKKAESDGEILFTDYGLSGPPIFNLSRLAAISKNGRIDIDLMTEFSKDEIFALLKERKMPDKALENYFTGMLPKKLGQVLLKACGIAPLSRRSLSLSTEELSQLADKIKAWSFEVRGTMSWNNAQATAGGVEVGDINPSTMESKLSDGLFLAGEILDIDGDCGGYNLQWAWSSGYIAGMNAAEKSRKGTGI